MSERYQAMPDQHKSVFASVLKLGGGGDDDDRNVTFRASTATKDRHGSIVLPEGIETDNFSKNPIFGWGHDLYFEPDIRNVIGKVIGFARSTQAFDVDVTFAPPEVNPNAEMALRMVHGQYLNMVSIGFIPIEAGFEVQDGDDVFVYRRVELLEVSLVPIPANPEAEVIRNAFERKYLTPPSDEADAGVLALRNARQEHEVRLAFQRWLKE